MSDVTGKQKAIDPDVEARLKAAGATRARSRAAADKADDALRALVLEALDQGASVRVVAFAAGIAPVTVAKWKSAR